MKQLSNYIGEALIKQHIKYHYVDFKIDENSLQWIDDDTKFVQSMPVEYKGDEVILVGEYHCADKKYVFEFQIYSEDAYMDSISIDQSNDIKPSNLEIFKDKLDQLK